PQQAPVINVPVDPPSPVWPAVAGLIVGILGTTASVFAAVAAMRAAKATEATVAHMQTVSLEQSRPYVVVSLELDLEEHWFELVLRNVGRTPALNVTATGGEIRTCVDRYNTENTGWPAVIASVAPGQEFRKMIGPDSLFYQEDSWHQDICLTLNYEDKTGTSYAESINLSFSAFEGAMYDNKHQRIERALREIASHTRIFDLGSSLRDPFFWRIWDSLAKSGLQMRLHQEGEGMIVTFARNRESRSTPTEATAEPTEAPAQPNVKERARKKGSNV
ncbi:MAG: hypothetical protein K8H99_06745, partial [Nitrospirae bacterium]|nr:hypothetical protein [Fimbriimonadaceae bacterium]